MLTPRTTDLHRLAAVGLVWLLFASPARSAPIDVEFTSAQPLLGAVEQFQDVHGWPVSYTDAWITYEGDIINVTDSFTPLTGVRPSVELYGIVGAALTFSYDPNLDPDPLVSAEAAAHAAVDAYNALNIVAQYRVVASDDRIEITPTHVHGPTGQYVPSGGLFDHEVTFKKRRVSFTSAVAQVMAQAKVHEDREVHLNIPAWRHPVKQGGTTTARDALLDAMRQSETQLAADGRHVIWAWRMHCFTNRPEDGCDVSFVPMPKTPPATPPPLPADRLCPTTFEANDEILGIVHAAAGATTWSCRGGGEAVSVGNGLELWKYSRDFGWNGSTFADLNILFNAEGPFEVLSPCTMNVVGASGRLDINADRMCLYGSRGVSVGTDASTADVGINAAAVTMESSEGPVALGPDLTVTTGHLAIQGLESVSIGPRCAITSGDAIVRSTGDTATSSVQIGTGTTITGEDLLVEAARAAALEGTTMLVSSGDVNLRSTGAGPDDLASVGAGASISTTGSDVVIEAFNRLVVADGATLTADIALRMDAQVCDISAGANLHGTEIIGTCAPDPTCSAFECKNGKVNVCHKPNDPAEKTLCISDNAVPAHLTHGDACGPCE